MNRISMYTPLQGASGSTSTMSSHWEVRIYDLGFVPADDLVRLITEYVSYMTFTVDGTHIVVALAGPDADIWDLLEQKLAEYEAKVLKALEVQKWANFAK